MYVLCLSVLVDRVIIMLLGSEKIVPPGVDFLCVLGCFRVELYKRFFYTNDLVSIGRGLLSSPGSMN